MNIYVKLSDFTQIDFFEVNIVMTMFIDLYVFNVLYWRKTKKEKLWSHKKWKMLKVYGVDGVCC